HPVALEFLEEVALLNAAGLASVINAFSPELLIIGGSVALGGYELVVEKALGRLGEFALNEVPPVRPATFGRDAVLMGAAALATRPPEELMRRR
ncbi:MAG: ROK family protein, partial [Thermoprotei archaeon]